jgi:hypothetical protein
MFLAGNKYRNMTLQVWGVSKNIINKICSRALWDSELRKAALALSSKKKD